MDQPEHRIHQRSAIAWASLGALGSGLSLPLCAWAFVPDLLLRTISPPTTFAWATAVGAIGMALIALPIAVVLTSARRSWSADAVRAWALWLTVGPFLLSWWLFSARAGQADVLTAAGLALVVLATAGLAWALGTRIAFLDPALARAWPVSLSIPLLALSGLGPLGPAPSLQPIATPRSPHRPPTLVEPVTGRPEIVLLLTIDTLRADHLGAWGYPRATSPVLDALAADGLRLGTLTAASSGTVPSFGVIHSGLGPECTGVVHQLSSVGDGVTTLAERFSDAGYQTLAVVTNHALDEKHGFHQGFDHFENLGQARGEDVVDRAMQVWEGTDSDVPVFAWVHLFDPHTPYVARDVPEFSGDPLDDPRVLPVIDFGSWGGVHRTRTLAEPIEESSIRAGRVVAAYDAEIAYADEQVGRLFEWMDRGGKLENTVVLFTSDHGETLYRGSNDAVFQHALQGWQDDLFVPGFIWAPGRVPADTLTTPARHIDLVPTLLDAARLPGDLALAGRSLLRSGERSTLAVGRSAWWDGLALELVPLERHRPIRTVEHGGWKLVAYPHTALAMLDGPGAWVHAWRGIFGGILQNDQLFHLIEDPGETRDRLHRNPDREAELRAMLEGELNRTVPEHCADTRGSDVVLDAETRERLRKMGYLE